MLRTDFVSNSSSSSFIVTMDTNNFDLDKVIKLLVKDSISDKNDDCSKEFKNIVKKHNNIILNYNLNYKRLAFIGYICKSKSDKTVTFDDTYKESKIFNTKKDFNCFVESIKNNKQYSVIEIVEGSSIRYYKHEYYNYPSQLVVNKDNYIFDIFEKSKNQYYERSESEIERLKNFTLKKIELDDCDVDHTYEIDMVSILNTRDLIKSGLDIHFLDNWMDLDYLENLIKKGKRIFNINNSHSGDGITCGSMYSLGCWPNTFNQSGCLNIISSQLT